MLWTIASAILRGWLARKLPELAPDVIAAVPGILKAVVHHIASADTGGAAHQRILDVHAGCRMAGCKVEPIVARAPDLVGE